MKKPSFPSRAEIRSLFICDELNGLITHLDGSNATYEQGSGYLYLCIRGYGFLVHRLIWMLAYDVEPPGMLDHINGDRSDNRISNLRLATNAQNVHNKKVNKNSKSGIKGVRYDEQRGKWRARIRHIHLGRFETKEEASNAYKNAAILHFGEFARP